MKKLLAFLLVLGMASIGMASVAQAGLILSVNGQPAPDTIDIPFENVPSGELVLDVMLEDGTVINGGDLEIRVTGPGSLDSSDLMFPAVTLHNWTDVEMPDYGLYVHKWQDTVKALGAPYAVAASDTTSVLITGGDLQWNTTGVAGEKLMDNLLFHCDGVGEVTIDLVAPSGLAMLLYGPDPTGPAGAPWPAPWLLPEVIGVGDVVGAGTVLDTITITQIPEPMTMSLLGLGGLALLRRRRA